YKTAIHQAVVSSSGYDDYTGEKLDWSLVCRYDNIRSKENGREYKASFALLPTVDHVGDGLGKADFKICAWRTNGAKTDLTHSQFIELCARVMAHWQRNPKQELASA